MKRILSLVVCLAFSALADPPSSNLVVNSANPIANSLKLLVMPGTTTFKNIVNGNDGTLMGSAALTAGAGPAGGSALVTSGASDGAYWPLPVPGIYGSAAHNWTIFVRAKITGWNDDYATIAGIPQNSTLASPSYSLALRRHSNTTAPAAMMSSFPTFLEYHPGDTGFFLLDGNFHTYAFTKVANIVYFYRDGVQYGTGSGMSDDFAIGWGSSPQPFTLFANASTVPYAGPFGATDVAGVWSRALSESELASVTADPYQLVVIPPPAYLISGTVTSAAANTKVRITGTGVDETVIADSSGNYAVTPVVAGTYTITPSRLGFVFVPTSRTVVVTSGPQTADFVPTTLTTGPAQITLEGVVQSQAGIVITGTSSPCTLNLFQGVSVDGIPHPDVINSVDTSRPDTITNANGSRLVWLGHNINNLALFEGQPHFLHAYCGPGGQATLSFVTPHPPSSTTPAPAVPFDPAKPFNFGGPAFDLTQAGVKVAMPHSGVAAEIVMGPFDRWWESQANAEGLGYAGRVGGAGWTIPDGSLDGINGPGSYATTSGTSSVILMPGDASGVRHSNNMTIQEALGFQLWGSGTDATEVNRVLNACITMDMIADTCGTNSDPKYSATPYIQIPLPTGSNSPVANSTTLAATMSTRSNTPWPVEYPMPAYIGWNTFVPSDRLPVKDITIYDISGGVVTAAKGWGDTNFLPEGLAGNYLFIPGVADVSCPGDFCPVGALLPNGQVKLAAPANTLTRAGTITGAVAYQYGIRIWKATTTGTISIGSRYTVAGRVGQAPGTAGTATCSPVPLVLNGKKGSNCLFTMKNSPRTVTWIADDRDVKPIYRTSLSWDQFNSFNTSIPNANDRPVGEDPFDQDAFWDNSNPNVLYTYAKTAGGSFAILRGELDASPVSDPTACVTTGAPAFTCRTVWAQTYNGNAISWQTGHVLWTNMTPASSTPAMDVFSQVNRAYPSYAANYPEYTGSGWKWVGVSGNIGFLKNDGGTQDANPCLIAAFDMTTRPSATLIRFLSTMSDSDMLAETAGGIEQFRWGACHGVFQDATFPNSVLVSNNAPGVKGFASGILGTPAMFKPIAVMAQDGTWIGDAACKAGTSYAGCDTSIKWPPPPAAGSSSTQYKSRWDGTPSADFKARLQQYIYAPNQYVRIRAAGSGDAAGKNWVCNRSTDMAALGYPVCGWDSSMHALPAKWKPIEGDSFTWSQASGKLCVDGDRNDCEKLTIVKIHAVTDAYVEFTALRSGSRYYSCPGADQIQINGAFGTPLGPNCLDTANTNPGDYYNQFWLTNGWMGNMVPGIHGYEYTKRLQLNLSGTTSNIINQVGEFAGHSTSGQNTNGTKHLIGYTSAITVNNMSDLNALYYTGQLPSYHQVARPSYGGVYGGNGFTQSYLQAASWRSDSVNRGSGIDLHHFANSGGGLNFEDKARTIVPVAALPSVYRYQHGDFNGTSDPDCNAACRAQKYKQFSPIYMLAGLRVYKDRSGPDCNMGTAPNYTLCYNYRPGITSGVAGSALGELFFKGPGIDIDAAIPVANNGVSQPLASWLGPMEGGLEQYMWQTDDYENGRWFSFMGYTAPPGLTQGFSEPSVNSFGNKVLTHSANFANGVSTLPLALNLPDRSTYIRDWSKTNLPGGKTGSVWNANVSIQVPALVGATHARAKWGTTKTFQCTESSEACVTDEAHTSPYDSFSWLAEAVSPTPCSTGCTLHISGIPGRLTVVQVEHTNSTGTVIGVEPAQFVGVH